MVVSETFILMYKHLLRFLGLSLCLEYFDNDLLFLNKESTLDPETERERREEGFISFMKHFTQSQSKISK